MPVPRAGKQRQHTYPQQPENHGDYQTEGGPAQNSAAILKVRAGVQSETLYQGALD